MSEGMTYNPLEQGVPKGLSASLEAVRKARREKEMHTTGAQRLAEIFDADQSSAAGRVAVLREKAAQFVGDLSEEQLAQTEAIFQELLTTTDKEAFVARGLGLLKILLAHQHADTTSLGEREYAEHRAQYPERTVVNKLLEFDDEGTEFRLHVPPNRFTEVKDLIRGLKSGMKDLAAIVESRPEVQKIVGKSWIIAQNPGLLVKLGFRVYSDREDAKASPPRAVAEMSREDLLRLWGARVSEP